MFVNLPDDMAHNTTDPTDETSPLLPSRTRSPDSGYSSATQIEQASQDEQSRKFSPGDVEAETIPEPSAIGRDLNWSSAYMLTISRVFGSGIFATPGVILAAVGSPGLSLLLWVAGGFLAYLGLTIYLEFGSMLPRSGSDKVYLEFTYRKPKYLASILVAVYAIFLGLTASNCVIFAQYMLFSLGVEGSEFSRKAIAVGLLAGITILHGCFRRAGIVVQNTLGYLKLFLIGVMIFSGLFVVLLKSSQHGHVQMDPSGSDPRPLNWSLDGLFSGSVCSLGTIAASVLKVFYSFAGLNNVNNVLNEVKDPVRTAKSVSLAALATAGSVYALVNVAYFLVVPLEEFRHSGELIGALFFERVFGTAVGRQFLPLLVALSAAGNVMVVTFALARVNQEIARTGLIPFSRALSSTKPFGSPLGGLIIHFIPSALVLTIPTGDVYSFILEVENYAGQIMAFAVAFALLWLRYKRPDLKRPFKAWIPGVVVRIIIAMALLVAPFVGHREGMFGGAVYALVGYAVLLIGVLYWALFAKILPSWLGYRLEDRTELLDDGTTVRSIARVPLTSS